jgi:hypothetical protein
VLTVVDTREAELPGLHDTIGHRQPHGHVLPRQRGLHEPVVDPPDDERHDVTGLPDLPLDLPGPPDRLGPHAPRAVQAALLVDQCLGHQPVDLVPRSGDLRGDRVAQHIADRRPVDPDDHRPAPLLIHLVSSSKQSIRGSSGEPGIGRALPALDHGPFDP